MEKCEICNQPVEKLYTLASATRVCLRCQTKLRELRKKLKKKQASEKK